MVKLYISKSYLTIASHQEYLAFSYDSSKLSWVFQKSVRCTESVLKSEGAIECCAFSPCENYFGVYFDKNIIIYNTSEWDTLCICAGERKASSLQFFPSTKVILLADKSGCASFYDFKNNKLQKVDLAFGHNSMLTTAIITDDEKFVITGDRDEKIRVTKYPNVYNIEKYCLGHKMFVSCLGFFPMDKRILISSSGDGTIKFWNFISGKELTSYDLNVDKGKNENHKVIITKFVSCRINQMVVLAILEYKSNEIRIINIKGDLNQGLKIEAMKTLLLKSTPWDIHFHNKILICLLPDQNNPLEFWSPELPEVKTDFDEIILCLNKNWDFLFDTSKKISDEIPVLFKREVDNLHEYEQRKKARLLKTGKTS